jgi:hypothetical protein
MADGIQGICGLTPSHFHLNVGSAQPHGPLRLIGLAGEQGGESFKANFTPIQGRSASHQTHCQHCHSQ